MKTYIINLLVLIPLVSFGGGSFCYTEELRPLLEQRMDVLELLEKNFTFEESGQAGRIGQNVNSELGGKRVGPYRILAKSKGIKNTFQYEITVKTELLCLDESGNASNMRDASTISETFTSVEIKPITQKN